VSRRRRILRLAMQVLLALSVFLVVSEWQTRRLLPRGDTPAPDFELATLDGQRVRLSDYRGKTVLLHFWTTWCGVCRHEVGALNALAESLDEDEVLLTVAGDGEDAEAVRRFVAERGVNYPVLLGGEDVVDAYRITMFPTNYFVNPEGRIAASTVGMSTRWMLRARMGCAR
jgi:peroxiredoxin